MNTIDKTSWGPGPWQKEPDFETFEHEGLTCVIRRAPNSGAFCGYVRIGRDHPFAGLDYSHSRVDKAIRIHGGLTYAKNMAPFEEPSPSPNCWWFGFDCAHSCDMKPHPECESLNVMRLFSALFEGEDTEDASYRTIDYVRAEVKKLATQLNAHDDTTFERTIH